MTTSKWKDRNLRFHQELGKLARIHSIPLDEAVLFLQSVLKKALFFNLFYLQPLNLLANSNIEIMG